VDFGYVEPGYSADRTVTVRNVGTVPMAGMAVASPPFSVLTPETYDLEPEDFTSVTIRFTPMTTKTFNGNVVFSGGQGSGVLVQGTSISGNAAITSGIRINEVAPWNTRGIQDSYGAYPDWIELYNENSEAVDLGGWTLTDDPENIEVYPLLPSGTSIPARGYLIIFATAETSLPGELHVGFELDELNGGHVGLYNSEDGQVSTMDYPGFDRADWSYAFFESSAEKTASGSNSETNTPTPNDENIDNEPSVGAVWPLRFKTSNMQYGYLDVIGLLWWGGWAEDELDFWCESATNRIAQKDAESDIACDMSIVREADLQWGLTFAGGETSGFTQPRTLEQVKRAFVSNSNVADVLIFDRALFDENPRGFTSHFKGQDNKYQRMTALFMGHPKFGIHTIAHELGHYAGLGLAGNYHINDPKNVMYSEEDFFTPGGGWTPNDLKEVNECECDLYQKGWAWTNEAGEVKSMPPDCFGE
jgi:hypothetical protein